MEKITLYTGGGAVVTRVLIPVFNILPDVIYWGTRTFVRKEGKYLEAFAVKAMQETKAEPDLDNIDFD